MKVKHLLVGLCTALCGGIFVAPVLATSYSYDVDVQFNFNSKLGVTITDADIKILDLAPGTSSDSNIVGITISTNNVAGYTLKATVGSAENASTNMTHTNNTNVFASIAEDASEASLSTDNTWGYSTSLDSGTTWDNFSGLPLYTATPKELNHTNNPASDIIQFKINAKAATAQPAGDYTNKINFIVVANVPPRTIDDVIPEKTMQAMNENICNLVEAIDEEGQTQLEDIRDGKMYWVTKLKDGNCWMTQNLDLDLESVSSQVTALTSENTDLNQIDTDSTQYYNTGYTQDANTGVITWTPRNSTFVRTSTTGSYWNNGSVNLYSNEEALSFDPGDWYITGTRIDSSSSCYFFDGPDRCPNMISTTEMDSDGMHRYIGNYYTFGAAIASDNADVNNNSYDDSNLTPKNSICPSNWRLPKISRYDYYFNDVGTNDFYNLVYYYNNKTTYNDIGLYNAPLYYTRFGYLSGGYQSSPGSYAYYRSATSYSSSDAYLTYAYNSYLSLDSSYGNSYATNVRCLTRANKYQLSFNGNGADSGSMETIYVEKGEKVTLPNNQFVKSGYLFTGWNTRADGTGTDYPVGSDYTSPRPGHGDSGTLYAQWHLYTIEYDANGGTGTMGKQEIPYGSSSALSSNTYSKDGKQFVSWNILEDGSSVRYEDGDIYSVPADEDRFGITLYAQWADTGNYTIRFDANGGSGSMSPQTVAFGERIRLTTNAYTKSGYKFIGWNTSANGNGRSYGDGNYFYAPNSNSETETTLYAIWGLSTSPSYTPSGTTDGITIQRAYEIAYTAMHKGMYEEQHNGQGDYALVNSWPPDNEPYKGYDVRFAMQDMTSEICNSVTVLEDQYQALDTRDNKLYWIVKLKDGKCWMTQNLDLDIVSDSSKPYTSNDTDLNEYGVKGYDLVNGYSKDGDVIKWVPERATSHVTSTPYSGHTYSRTDPASVDIGDWYWSDTWYDSGGSGNEYFLEPSYVPTGNFSQSPFPIYGEHHHLGNYYNWSAAVASNNTTSLTGYSVDAPENRPDNSICPKGWRLPITNIYPYYDEEIPKPTHEDFYDLVYFYSRGNTMITDRPLYESPFYFVRAGAWNTNRNTHSGIFGEYWMSSYSDISGYAFASFGTEDISIHGPDRAGSWSVRCIAR